jgi:hypothetical protein
MTDKKDEPIIDLTEVVEEAPGPSEGAWIQSSPSPAPPAAPEKKAPEPPPVPPKKEPLRMAEELKGIPDSPLKKFILAEEEAPGQFSTPPAKAPGFPPLSPQPPRIFPEPSRPTPAPRVNFPEAPKTFPEPPPVPSEPARPSPEPPKPPVLNVEAELRSIREAMLSRVERWVSQEGVQVLERAAREMFPKIAEEVLRKEIEKIKADAEERE